MSERSLVDWKLAERVATAVAGDGGWATAPPAPFGQDALVTAVSEVLDPVRDYTELHPPAALPHPEAVSRPQWTRIGLATLREVSAGLERELAVHLRLPGLLGSMARAAAGAETGLAVGYASRRVLGQYDLSLGQTSRTPRLVFVSPNLAAAARGLAEPPALFLRWIVMHELTHALQFGTVAWLEPHLRSLVSELVESASRQLEPRRLVQAGRRLLRSDPRATVRALLQGELPRLFAGPEQAAILDRLQAAMAMIEGYAEHAMDAVGSTLDPGYERLRRRFDAHRRQGGLADVVARLLGLELKLRQYRVGKAFCDSVVAEAGIRGLNAAWRSPGELPSLDELERPAEWLARTSAASAGAPA